MRRPGFLEGAAVAFAAAVLGSGAALLLAPVVGNPLALRLAVAGIGLGYVVYLLRRARARVGRVSVALLWATLTGLAFGLGSDAPLALHALVQLAVASLVRGVWFHRGALAALADLGLVAAGLAAGAWATEHAASFALAVWCVLLVQACFTALPAGSGARRADAVALDPPDPDHSAFEQAHGVAEAAVRRLSTHS